MRTGKVTRWMCRVANKGTRTIEPGGCVDPWTPGMTA
jgi:hypothetical protein